MGSLGTHNALGLAKEKRARFLLASTSECYGDPERHPQREDYWGNVNPVGPRGCYDEAKRFAEAMTMAYHRAHGVDTRIVRIFNTYGPRMRLRDGRVVPNFIAPGPAGRAADRATATARRRARSATSMTSSTASGGSASSDFHEPVNIGNPNEMTIRDFAEKIVALTGSGSSVAYHPLPVDDPKVRRPDISRARSLLGWEPEVGLDDGLRRTIEFFRPRM